MGCIILFVIIALVATFADSIPGKIVLCAAASAIGILIAEADCRYLIFDNICKSMCCCDGGCYSGSNFASDHQLALHIWLNYRSYRIIIIPHKTIRLR